MKAKAKAKAKDTKAQIEAGRAVRGVDICAGCGTRECFNVCCHPSNKQRVASIKETKPLPKTWRGAEVVRGSGMKSDDLDTFLEKKALDGFDAKRAMWIVVEDGALDDLDDSVEIKGFADKDDAIRFAQARANGNVDHRVLRVTDQVLVVGTMNDL